ncbi:hypothetical protein [Solimonas terrae]|nr:hypothetical protein [Solimonas terrae]
MADGSEFDLAPGFVPILRPGKVPKNITTGPTTLVARDADDAKRLIGILNKRGLKAEQLTARAVSEKAPETRLRVMFDGPKITRTLAKTALTAACVLYGNAMVRRKADWCLCLAVKSGTPDINDYAGWDYSQGWPTNICWVPAEQCIDKSMSGFEHAVMFSDVGDDWVAYVSLFGDFRFSVRLGKKSGLPPEGLAINPRGTKHSRLSGTFTVSEHFERHWNGRFSAEHATVSAGVTGAFNSVLSRWQAESRSELDEKRDQELGQALSAAGPDPGDIEKATARLLGKWMTIELGDRWEEDLDPVSIDKK